MLKENQTLLDANRVKVKDNKLEEGIKLNIKQKPNRKILFAFKFHLTMYRLGVSFKHSNKFSRWLTNTVGEPPVIYDSTTAESSVSSIKQYLFNNGYFISDVHFTSKTILKYTTVTYHINLGPRYIIDSINYIFEDSTIAPIYYKDIKNSFIKIGDPFLNFNFVNERLRITNLYKNNGYYTYSNDYTNYTVDSTSNKLKVTIIFKSPEGGGQHKVYTIGKILLECDTAGTKRLVDLEETYDGIIFKRNGYAMRKSVLARAINFRTGDIYKIDSVGYTYSELVQLQLFKFINIKFDVPDTNYNILNCVIKIMPMVKQSIIYEPQLTLADQSSTLQVTGTYRNYGIVNSVKYTNNNLLKRGDIFRVRFRNSSEYQLSKTAGNTNYYSIENSLNASIDFPGLRISPRFTKILNPNKSLLNRTSYSASIIWETNRDFDRRLFVLNWSYSWRSRKNPLKNNTFVPLEASYILTKNLSSSLGEYLKTPQGQLVKNLFGQNLITAVRYARSYSNQSIHRGRSWINRTWNVETSGNMGRFVLPVLDSALHLPNVEIQNGILKVWGARYFSYIKTDLDIRHYTKFTKKRILVMRFNGGIGIPTWGESSLPYEKRYFSGGAISLRGWQIRTLGPGTFDDTNNVINRTADMKIEGNIEYRFPLVKFFGNTLEAGVFSDFGNIWLLQYNPNFVGANINWKNFKEGIAVDAGIGLRFNFNFFIIRIDGAVPMRNPGKIAGERWVYNNYNNPRSVYRATNINFGIGYPF